MTDLFSALREGRATKWSSGVIRCPAAVFLPTRPSRVAHKRTVGAEAAAMSCARAISGMSSNDSNANRATRRTLATLPHSITVPRHAGLTSTLLRREEYAEMMAWRHALVGCLLLVAACGVPELPGQA